MILDQDTARKTAELLLQIKAIKLKPQEPFTWASGWKSPIYCDNRIILSYPEARQFVREQMANQLKERFGTPEVIAGVATGAIGIGILVAEYLGLPFVYVRPEAKKHGRQNQIEGYLAEGSRVVVVEDLISTGKSSLNAVEALKSAGAEIMGMQAIFSYGFDVSIHNFKAEQINYQTLSNYEVLIEEAVRTEYLKKEDLNLLKTWREDPSNWQQK